VLRREAFDATTPFSYGDQPPASETPSASGLKYMSSDVAEWVADWYRPYSPQRQVNPVGPVPGKARVIRGGGLVEGACGRNLFEPLSSYDWLKYV
jgi:formylglycine-generating enzyme required for sulfatase activity